MLITPEYKFMCLKAHDLQEWWKSDIKTSDVYDKPHLISNINIGHWFIDLQTNKHFLISGKKNTSSGRFSNNIFYDIPDYEFSFIEHSKLCKQNIKWIPSVDDLLYILIKIEKMSFIISDTINTLNQSLLYVIMKKKYKLTWDKDNKEWFSFVEK